MYNSKNYGIYIDGFNLYYRLLKKYPQYRWLNVKLLFESFNFKFYPIAVIRYFTAKVGSSKKDHSIHIRQNIYLRALRTIPEMHIHYGQFKKREVMGKLEERDNLSFGRIVKVSKFEEKGSDVNLASYMLLDCFSGRCDVPILISNDSDLSTPLKIIKTVFKKPIGLITPDTNKKMAVQDLKKYASFHKGISEIQLQQSQFPRVMTDKEGSFYRPKQWV